MTHVHIDDSELRTLELDLSGFPLRVKLNAQRVMKRRIGPKLAQEMKVDAKGAQRSRPSTIRHLPKAVDWELIDQGWGVEAGFKPGQQGSLAHLLAYGTAHSAPVYDHTQALGRTDGEAQRWIADAAADAVLGDD